MRLFLRELKAKRATYSALFVLSLFFNQGYFFVFIIQLAF